MTLGGVSSLAFSALLRNRMRSSLTMLGVVIGVGAVLMMRSAGEGATTYVGDAISGLGTNMLMVVPGASKQMGPTNSGAPPFTLGDLEALRRSHDVALLAPVGSRPLRVVAGGYNRNPQVLGVGTDYLEVRDWGAALGRVISREDERQAAQVCLLGESVRQALFPGSGPEVLGSEVRVHDLPCRVIGVLEVKGASAFGTDQDDVVMMPFSTFSRRIAGSERVSMIIASAVDKDRIDDARSQITSVLRERRHVMEGEDEDFSVRDPREMQALLQQVTGMLTAFLLGVAGISLLVGGIGIMNIMLVSVTERTREIGIRMAVGARSTDILSQFLVESVVLSATGGLLGVGLGLLGALGLSRVLHVPFVLPGTAIPVALGTSLLVGVIFGVFPARKAARLNTLAALRFE